MLLQGLITWGVKLRDNPYPTQSCFFNDGGDIMRPVHVSLRKGSHFAASKNVSFLGFIFAQTFFVQMQMYQFLKPLKSKSITSNLGRWNFRMGKMDRLLGANGRRSTYSSP